MSICNSLTRNYMNKTTNRYSYISSRLSNDLNQSLWDKNSKIDNSLGITKEKAQPKKTFNGVLKVHF